MKLLGRMIRLSLDVLSVYVIACLAAEYEISHHIETFSLGWFFLALTATGCWFLLQYAMDVIQKRS